jgi:hypothetical protein
METRAEGGGCSGLTRLSMLVGISWESHLLTLHFKLGSSPFFLPLNFDVRIDQWL